MSSLLHKIKNKEQNIFDNFIFIVIILSAVLLGFETDSDLYQNNIHFFHYFDIAILTIFIAEIIIKCLAQGKEPWKYFTDPWNLFDFGIVVFSILPYLLTHGQDDTHIIMVFRLLRLARALRVLRVFRLVTHLKPLQLIIETLIKSVPSIFYVLVLLGVWFYVYAILGVFLFGKHDIDKFGNLHSAFLTMFECATGDWTSTMTSLITMNAKANPPFVFSEFIPLYFISFYFMGGLIILNMFIGIIVSELQVTKLRLEREELRKHFEDDMDAGSSQLVKDLEVQIDGINETFRKLQIALDKNKSG